MDPPTAHEMKAIHSLPEHRKVKLQARTITWIGGVVLIFELALVGTSAAWGFFVLLYRQYLMVLFATETLAALLAYLCALLLCHDIKTLQDRAQLLLDIGRLSFLLIARTSLLLILYADARSAHTRDLFMRGCGVEGRGCSVRAGCFSSNTCQHLWQSYRICPAVVASLALFSGIVQIALFLRLWQSRLVNPSPASSSHYVFDNESTVSRDNIRLNGLRRKQSCDAPILDSDGEDGPPEERLTRTIVTRQSAACS